MEKREITYRLADTKNSSEDIDTILRFQLKVSEYLNEDYDNALDLRHDIIFRANIVENRKSGFYFAEHNGRPVGYIEVMHYFGIYNYKSSIIQSIFVEDEYRNGGIAFNLLKLGLQEIQRIGKNNAVLCVQEDNPNRFLHYAVADKLLGNYNKAYKKDGSVAQEYDLLISDISEILKMTEREIAKKAIKLKRENFDPTQYGKEME